MRLRSLLGWRGRKKATVYSTESARREEDDEAFSTASSASLHSTRVKPIGRYVRSNDPFDPPLPTVQRTHEDAISSAQRLSGDDTLSPRDEDLASTRLTPRESPAIEVGSTDSEAGPSSKRKSRPKSLRHEPETPRLFESEPDWPIDREAELPIGRGLSMTPAALLPCGGRPPRKEDGLSLLDKKSANAVSEKPPLGPPHSSELDAKSKALFETKHEPQSTPLQLESQPETRSDRLPERPAAKSALEDSQAELKVSSSQMSISSDSEPVTSPFSKSGVSKISDLASLSFPSTSLSFLIHGMSVERVSALAASASQHGDNVRKVVESAYADAIQEVGR